MKPKPSHLGPEYGQQFSDQSVSDAYPTRPPYPAQIIELLARLAKDEPRNVLELGCGTGDITRLLAPHVAQIDAVDPSAAMLDKARSLPNGTAPNIRWIQQTAEDFDYAHTYSLILAAESLHWMEWELIFPKIRQALSPNGRLALILGRDLNPILWQEPLTALIAKYSTNREFKPYDLLDELKQRQLFQVEAQIQTAPVAWDQSVGDYLESFHSRNGFSRERMGASADEFDAQLSALVSPYARDGRLSFDLTAHIAWGLPLPE